MSDDSTVSEVLSVTQVGERIRGVVANWPAVWIEGEIDKWSPWRGIQVYASIKDDSSVLNLVIPAEVVTTSGTDFTAGDKVRVFGKIDYNPRRGDVTVKVSAIRKEGLGDFLLSVEKLRQQLLAEGAFDPSRKVPLPPLPLCIGLITSEKSDAEQDVRKNVLERWSDAKIKAVYTGVSRELAIKEVPPAIAKLDADPEVDVIIIARGGGSPIELLAFSDESIVRAAMACTTPIISAIGHENDHPLLDDVADLRASTPTDAAKRVVPDVVHELAAILDARQRIRQRVTMLVTTETDRIAQLRSRPVMASPAAYLDARRDDLIATVRRGSQIVDHRVEVASQSLAGIKAQLRALSPQSTLDRGYSILRDARGRVIVSTSAVTTGDDLTVRVADGDIDVSAK